MIARMAENEVLELLSTFPVVGLVGPRQVGKTTLAHQVTGRMNREVVYLDLELPEDIAKLQQPALYLKEHTDKCVVLDEIQRMPELFPVLRSLIDQNRIPGRFIILGSATPNLLINSSESFAGRIAYKELMPLSLSEINHTTTLEKHWLQGGFPDSLLAANSQASFRWRRNFIQTYLEKDLPLLGLQTNLNRLREFVTMLASAQAQLWKAEAFARALGVTAPVIKRYLHYLENAFLVEVLQPYYVNIKKRLVKSPKVYIRDTGLLHTLLRIETFEELQNQVAIGQSWETYVISQVKCQLPDNWSMYFYRTHEGAEADLVLVKGTQPAACLEIKYSNAPMVSKGLHHVIADLKTDKNFIITPSSEKYPVAQKIQVVNIQDFLSILNGWK
ncbi:MAG: ATP-binding protein [Flammeovirgaceae bacterium]|nr:MAG: ATP-binding protein [Flammeovirgaceae bacterium]